MRKIFWAAAIVLASSIPAHAQYGSLGGGSIGKIAAPRATPPTVFSASALSGSQADFTPSTFILFNDGLAEGKLLLDAKPKTLGEIAAEYRQAPRPKAKVLLTQDDYGYAVIETK